MVRRDAFREDLVYRINVIPIPLPPLRSRTEDIAPLPTHFIAQITGGPADIAAVRQYRTRPGLGVNLEQEITRGHFRQVHFVRASALPLPFELARRKIAGDDTFQILRSPRGSAQPRDAAPDRRRTGPRYRAYRQ